MDISAHTQGANTALALTELRAAARNHTTILRDPRAAQRVADRNITIPETCRYYGVETATPNTCRVPRSCQDCLLMPGCVIAGSGQCVSVDDFEGRVAFQIDYHRTLKSYPLGNAFNRSITGDEIPTSFFAANATYCNVSDPVCTQCRDEFQILANSITTVDVLSTQFCVGNAGCVCVAICEAPRARAPRVYDTTCGQPEPDALVSTELGRRNTTMTHRDPRSPPLDFLDRKLPEETCQFHAGKDMRGCRQPRTCQDCLLQPAVCVGQNCVIADFKCMTMGHYIPAQDFRSARYGAGDGNYSRMPTAMFPSANTTYCASSDEYCRSQFFPIGRPDKPWKDIARVSTFGIGRDGCVCVQACEVYQWSSGNYDTDCTNLGGLGKRTDSQVHVATGAITVIVWITLLVLYKRSKGELIAPTRRAMERAGVQIMRHMLDEVPALGRLDLFGWRRFQERLAFKEQQLLQGEDLLSPVRPPVDFDLAASAPDFDEDDSSAPMAHDARALATAPMYRQSISDSDEEDGDPWAPSAPDFDLDDPLRLPQDTRDDSRSIGGFSRRSRSSR